MNDLTLSLVVYWGLLIGWTVFVFFLMWYMTSLTLAMWHGAPFVPTKRKRLTDIFTRAKLQKGQKFLELGCGDARVSREAMKLHGVTARGVEIQRLWLLLAGILNKMNRVQMELRHEYIEHTDLGWADVIYVFMMPRFLKKFQHQIETTVRPGTTIISHGFEIDYLRHLQYDRIFSRPFSTYFYRL